MQYFYFDQYDFEYWESEETFALCRQRPGQRGTNIFKLNGFVKSTQNFGVFKEIPIRKIKESDTGNYRPQITNFNTVADLCSKNLSITLDPLIVYHVLLADALTLDMAWLDKNDKWFYRAFWESTA